MKPRYRLFKRGPVFYAHENKSGKQQSLKTKNKKDAQRILHAMNESHQSPEINLHIARAYLKASDPDIGRRTWQLALEEIIKHRHGNTKVRWETALKDKAFDLIRQRPILETRPADFLKVLEVGSVSTNVFLRRVHNFALDMEWLPMPVLCPKRWPKVRHGQKRAITKEEHQAVIAIEWIPERKAYYELLWHLGGSQSDIANLLAEEIDWKNNTLAYTRAKTAEVAVIPLSPDVRVILESLPSHGFLFPRMRRMDEKHRATEFRARCKRLKIEGVTLHSYRYAWAQRAKDAGYPERFAQIALGHNSKAVHRAYSRSPLTRIPGLHEYERSNKERKLLKDSQKETNL